MADIADTYLHSILRYASQKFPHPHRLCPRRPSLYRRVMFDVETKMIILFIFIYTEFE